MQLAVEEMILAGILASVNRYRVVIASYQSRGLGWARRHAEASGAVELTERVVRIESAAPDHATIGSQEMLDLVAKLDDGC